MKKVTIKDVASLSGVSISTVSRYLTNPSSINPISAVSVGKAIRELEYSPNPFAQNLKTQNVKVIAIIIPDIANGYFGEACKAMCTLCYDAKYLVMMCDCDNDSGKERFYIEEMIRNRVAGLIISTTGGNGDYLQRIVAAGQRVVLFDRTEPSVDADAVYEDNEASSYNLTRSLIVQGHRRFAVLNGTDLSNTMRQRLLGVQRATEEEGIMLEEEYIIRNLRNRSEVVRQVEILVGDPNAPRCIIANNPVILDALVQTLSRLGLAVPRDYCPAGFAIKDPSHSYPFPVPAVLQHPAEVGLRAGELMIKRLRKNSQSYTPKRILLPTTLKT